MSLLRLPTFPAQPTKLHLAPPHAYGKLYNAYKKASAADRAVTIGEPGIEDAAFDRSGFVCNKQYIRVPPPPPLPTPRQHIRQISSHNEPDTPGK